MREHNRNTVKMHNFILFVQFVKHYKSRETFNPLSFFYISFFPYYIISYTIYILYCSFLLCSFSFLVAFYIIVSLSVLSLLYDYNIRIRHNRNKYKNVALYVAEKLLFVGVGLPCGLLVVSFRCCGRWYWFFVFVK